MTEASPAGVKRTSPGDLDEIAWGWLHLMKSGHATEADADRFQRWVLADPRHRAAYVGARDAWKALGQSASRWRHGNPNISVLLGKRAGAPVRSRRMFLGSALGAGAAAAVAAVGVFHPPLGLWQPPSEWGADYRTATGEQRTVAMAQHVNVTLNTQTSVRRSMHGEETSGVQLLSGELAVDFEPSAPSFTVAAGVGRSAAASGQFMVRYLGGRVSVTCIAGTVRVSHPAGECTLAQNQQVIYNDRALSGTASVDTADAIAWREGVLVLHEVRLADAIGEINRYRAGRVVLMNAAAAERRITGNFRTATLDQTLVQMQHAFGLKGHALGDLLLLS